MENIIDGIKTQSVDKIPDQKSFFINKGNNIFFLV